jgi:hypothetical protein
MDLGTYRIADLIAVETLSAVDYGLDTIAEVIAADLRAWNALVSDGLNIMSTDTTERLERHGSSTNFEMLKGDEFARGVAGVARGGSDVAYPLEKFLVNVGWTMDFLKEATPADIARAIMGIQKSHLQAVNTELRRAFFKPTNYTFNDDLIDGSALGVKRLYNADGVDIPEGPYGATFAGGSHTHYNANATLTDAELVAAITDVQEHRAQSSIAIITTPAGVADFEALTNYLALPGPAITPAEDADRPTMRLNASVTDNRQVGVYAGAYPVWTKPWGLDNYALVMDVNGERPLKRRQRVQSGLRGLRMRNQDDTLPLRVQSFEAEFGFGVWDRSAAAILQFNNAAYQDPAI